MKQLNLRDFAVSESRVSALMPLNDVVTFAASSELLAHAVMEFAF